LLPGSGAHLSRTEKEEAELATAPKGIVLQVVKAGESTLKVYLDRCVKDTVSNRVNTKYALSDFTRKHFSRSVTYNT
jgi:hypothetical protein